MTHPPLNRWMLAAISGLFLNAGVINLSYLIPIGNTLPIQIVLSLISLMILFRVKTKSIAVLTVTAITFFLIALFNSSDPTSLATNPAIPLLGLMAFLAGYQLRTRNQQTLSLALFVFFAFQFIFQAYFNLSFSPTDMMNGRSKGYGSGTTYALMAATFLIYLTSMLRLRHLHLVTFLALASLPLWTVFLTQSRGVFLSLVIIIVLKSLGSMKSFFKFSSLAVVAICIAALNPQFINNIPLIDRLVGFGNQFDLQAYTSGRIETQIVILNWFWSESSILSLLLGAEGLNGIKILASKGFEFPHFDLLYLLYDTGLVGAALFLFLMAFLLVRTRFDSNVLLFFISTLHTNMVLSPTFLLLAFALHHLNQPKDQNTKNVQTLRTNSTIHETS